MLRQSEKPRANRSFDFDVLWETTCGQEPPPARVRQFALKRTLSGSIILESRAEEKAMSTSGKVTVDRDGRTYAATYTVEGDMVHVKTHTETRSVALGGKRPEEIARRELNEIVEASRRH
jgi:hypothetical protein